MKSLDVFTQEELDHALAEPDVIPVCAGEGTFAVSGDRFVRAADFAHVTVSDTVAVEAGGSSTIVAGDDASVRAVHAVTVEASDRAHVIANGRAFVLAHDDVTVTAGTSAVVEATGSVVVTAMARSTVRATDSCRVRVLSTAQATVSGEARAFAWGRSVVRASDEAVIHAWGSASVEATGSAVVEARGSAMVTAGGKATVRAFGSSMVRARGQARVEAADGVSVTRHSPRVTVSGGSVTEAVRFSNAEEWCSHHGVEVNDGVAILFKAVDEDFNSYHGMSYRPGTEPFAPDWDGGEQECGGGLHFSPRPTFALARPDDSMRFVACPVRLEEIVVYPRGDYPDQVKAPRVAAPVYEVHEDGTPVEATTPAAG